MQWADLLEENRFTELGKALPNDGVYAPFFRGAVGNHSVLFVSEALKE